MFQHRANGIHQQFDQRDTVCARKPALCTFQQGLGSAGLIRSADKSGEQAFLVLAGQIFLK